jgi:hypothetical protein
MKFWAIRRPSDGAFLPEVRKGYTYSEPRFDLPPRLFTSKGAAKTALTHWLRGAFSVHVTHHFGFEDDFVDVKRKVTKIEGRVEQGLVVVCIKLKEVRE